MPNLVSLNKYTAQVTRLRRQVLQARTVEEAVQLLAAADAIEEAMCAAGYRNNTEIIRPANEARFEARWRLGQLLAKIERAQVPGTGRGHKGEKSMSAGRAGFRAYLKQLGLGKTSANECERIGAMPKE
jgi:hypothetical protein